jgi:hypothetical protein
MHVTADIDWTSDLFKQIYRLVKCLSAQMGKYALTIIEIGSKLAISGMKLPNCTAETRRKDAIRPALS